MKVINITQKEAECVIRHMDALRMQHIRNEKADFSEPCCNCSHVHECKSDSWHDNIQNLSVISGVFINPVYTAQANKDAVKLEKLDETVDSICDWIQSALKSENAMERYSERVEMTKALAALVSARGISKEEIIKVFTKELNDSLKLEGNCSYEF